MKLTELGFYKEKERIKKAEQAVQNLYKILSEKDRVTQTHPRVTNEKEGDSMTPSDTDDTPRVTSMTPCSDRCHPY